MKRLFTKCKASKCSEFVALMDWLNTPTEDIGSSPAQKFLGRRCKTLLPAHEVLLQPQYSTERDSQAIYRQKQKQQQHYDAHSKPLKPLAAEDSVRMKLPGEKTWTQGVCAGLVGPRSYEVKMGDRVFVRNRRHLLASDEPIRDQVPEPLESTGQYDVVTTPGSPHTPVRQPEEDRGNAIPLESGNEPLPETSSNKHTYPSSKVRS